MNFKYLVTLVNSPLFLVNREKSQQGFQLHRIQTAKITARFRILEIFS